MAINENANVNVDVNGKPAEDKMNALQAKAKELKKSLQEAFEAGDVKNYEKQKAELGKIRNEAKSLERQMWDIDKVMRNLGGATPKELKRAFNQLNREINSGEVKRGSAEWKKLTSNLRQVKAEMRKVNTEIGSVSNSSVKLRMSWSNLFATLGIASIGYQLIGFFKNMVKASAEFEKSLSSLSAITGLVGNDLEFFKEQALATSGQTLKSANDIVKAYELVGSIRPELLKNKEALAEVTKQAIILSEATGGKLGLEEAAIATAGTLNQFSKSSSEAADVINVLAAGSKFGSAAVVDITKSIGKFGAVADAANMPLEQSVGLIETLAEKLIKGEEAGTKLRNIIIKLQGDQANYRDGVFDVNLALENLAKSKANVTDLTKMFGDENVVAAQILVKSRQKVIDYTEAVTGTNTALEQQSIQNNNLDGALTQMSNTWNTFLLKLNKSNGALADNIRFITMLISKYDEFDAVFSRKGLIRGMLNYKETLDEIKKEEQIEASKIFDANGIIKNTTLASKSIEDLDTLTKRLTNESQIYFENWKKSEGDQASFWSAQYDIAKQNIELINKAKLEASGADSGGETPEQKAARLAKEAAEKQQQVAEETRKLFLSDMQIKFEAIDKEANALREKGIKEVDIARWVAMEKEKVYAAQEKSKSFDPTKLTAPDSQIEYEQWKAKELQKYREDDLQAIQDKFERESVLAQTKHNDEMLALGTDEAAKKALKEKFDAEELQRNLEHLNSLKAQLEETLADTSLESSMLSDEERDELLLKIEELQFAISALKLEMNDSADPTNTGRGLLNKMIFGIDGDDKLAERIQKIGDFAVSVMRSVNQIITNGEQRQLQEFETANNKKKQALEERLKAGTISQASYNAQMSALDNELDSKKRKLAHDQAKRAKSLALTMAIISGAAAVINGFNTQPFFPVGLAMGALAAILAGVQIAAIASEPIPALATGKYPVTATDGRTYNASLYGKANKTEIVKGPALISEVSDEMIVDGPTTRNLVFNYPHIVEGIKQLSSGGVPQFADGNYPVSSTQQTNNPISSTMTATTDPALHALLERLLSKLDEPSTAYLVADENYMRTHKKKSNEYDSFMNKVAG